MAQKSKKELAEKYDLLSEYGEVSEAIYNYIIMSYLNNQRKQAAEIFKQLYDYDKQEFMKSFLNPRVDLSHKSVLNMCIDVLILERE